MNNFQRDLITEAYVQHLENGCRSDVAGAYNDTIDFFNNLKDTDKKLQERLENAKIEWENE